MLKFEDILEPVKRIIAGAEEFTRLVEAEIKPFTTDSMSKEEIAAIKSQIMDTAASSDNSMVLKFLMLGRMEVEKTLAAKAAAARAAAARERSPGIPGATPRNPIRTA